jgi:hypothetical protein
VGRPRARSLKQDPPATGPSRSRSRSIDLLGGDNGGGGGKGKFEALFAAMKETSRGKGETRNEGKNGKCGVAEDDRDKSI